MTVDRRNIAGYPPTPDGTIDAADRAGIAGLPASETTTPPPSAGVNSIDQMMIDGMNMLLTLRGESIVYYPVSGSSRTILALVDRVGPQDIPELPEGTTEAFRINVLNDATLGISSAEINLRKSKVGLPRRLGLSNQTRVILAIENQNGAKLQILAA